MRKLISILRKVGVLVENIVEVSNLPSELWFVFKCKDLEEV
jgi:hypothetical protein